MMICPIMSYRTPTLGRFERLRRKACDREDCAQWVSAGQLSKLSGRTDLDEVTEGNDGICSHKLSALGILLQADDQHPLW